MFTQTSLYRELIIIYLKISALKMHILYMLQAIIIECFHVGLCEEVINEMIVQIYISKL